MLCAFCNDPAFYTVRGSYNILYNCCKECYLKSQTTAKPLSISCAWKGCNDVCTPEST